MNHIEVLGNLTKEVDVRITSKQKTMAMFTVAENYYDFFSKERKTQYFRVVAYGKKAEIIADHFGKGSRINVKGNMEHVQFTGDDGKEREFWRIILNDFDFCEKKKTENQS